VIVGPNTYLLGPKVIAAGERAFIVYASEIARNWDIFAVECGPKGPGSRSSSVPILHPTSNRTDSGRTEFSG